MKSMAGDSWNRRRVLRAAGWAAGYAAIPLSGSAAEMGRFSARHQQQSDALAPGEHLLEDNNGRPSILYLPPSYDATVAAPFLLMLHGARGDGRRTLEQQRAAADEQGVALLCASSRSGTWDAIRGTFSHDFNTLDELLAQTFMRCNIDPARTAIGGFSDGASYGLTLGLMNGDLFTHVIAHSPGFIISSDWHGKPKVYISHGRQDEVLPFDRCGAVIARRLTDAGYEPRFDVFDGGHTASTALRSAALQWMKSV